MKSLFCLVLGFCGDVSMIPFLMEEAGRMEKDYPKEILWLWAGISSAGISGTLFRGNIKTNKD